jgi:hypothetical protein
MENQDQLKEKYLTIKTRTLKDGTTTTYKYDYRKYSKQYDDKGNYIKTKTFTPRNLMKKYTRTMTDEQIAKVIKYIEKKVLNKFDPKYKVKK